MLEPIMMARIAEAHYRDLMREAERERLSAHSGDGKTDLLYGSVFRVGDLLISVGQWLKELSAATTPEVDLPAVRAG